MRYLGFLLVMTGLTTSQAEVFLRWNQAGYRPDRPIRIVVLSAEDLAGEGWTVELDGHRWAEGELGDSVAGVGPHTPLPFTHTVELAAGQAAPGTHVFRIGGQTAAIRVDNDPYGRFVQAPLVHLRRMRSGAAVEAPRRPSHPGDATAPVWVPDGDPMSGRWKPDPSGRVVDVEGGWYDAGDQLKFTLNIAYTTFHLLLASQLSGTWMPVDSSESDSAAIRDEARHGLDWLMKVHPDRETFVVQVGDERDHNQPYRLPEDDALDGDRPALCALSRVHMASASAALAMGALAWKDSDEETASVYQAMAERIFARAREPDTILTAFERGKVNDFYLDDTEDDQMALAAMVLSQVTGDDDYRALASDLAPPAVNEPSWRAWNWMANLALAYWGDDAAARERLQAEIGNYQEHARVAGGPWGLPGRYVWGSLHRWVECALAARLSSMAHESPFEGDRLFEDMIDYVFGRNNWGVSFLFSEDLPNSLQNLYSPLYELLDLFPKGAFSEGPGNRATHDTLRTYFEIPDDDPFHRFNTGTAVFFDHSSDFMCQEATIGGQADIVLLLVLAGFSSSR